MGKDERVREISIFSKLLSRPEFGAVSGAVAILLFFYVIVGDAGMFSALGVINFLELAAQLSIIAMAASLLMIGGEFDLSLGSMVGFAGVCVAISVEVFGLPIWAGVFVALSVSLLVGYINGILVITTRLPSFIVTLAMLFILRGLCVVTIRGLTGRTQTYIPREMVETDWFAWLFAGKAFAPLFQWMADAGIIDARPDGIPFVQGVPASILWMIGILIFTTVMLGFTRFGNWIFATGGDEKSARNMGVPTARVKILLFMGTSFSAALLACIQVLSSASADALRGTLKEFEAIIAAVIGGALLTGGYGSTVGAAVGALIFATIQQGIYYTGIDTDWFKVILGGMVLFAVIFNNYLRHKVTGEK